MQMIGTGEAGVGQPFSPQKLKRTYITANRIDHRQWSCCECEETMTSGLQNCPCPIREKVHLE